MMQIKLKSKIALYVLLIFFTVVPMVAIGSLVYFKARLQQSIEAQQKSLVEVVAGELDEKIRLAQNALITSAGIITPEIAGNPKRADSFLRANITLNLLFDSNLLLITPSGKLIAETALPTSRTGRDFSFREYFQKTIATGKPVITKPYISSLPNSRPVIAFTAPVKGKDGSMYAIIVGTIDLLRPNFLGRLATLKIGESGYLFIFNRDRTMVFHPDPARIMKNDIPQGANLLLDIALANGDVVGETLNSKGNRMLTAFRCLTATDWILAVNIPVQEAFAPVEKAKTSLIYLVVCGGFLIILIMWLIMRRLTFPLLSLNTQIQTIESLGEYCPVDVRSGDEIEELADTFNDIMKKLAIANQNLHHELTERKKVEEALFANVAELKQTLARVRLLEGIIPICMYCKKIRDDENSWNQLEHYISDHSEAQFSHGICPECVDEHFPSLNLKKNIPKGCHCS